MLHQVNGRRSKAYKSVAEDSKLWVCRPNRALHVRTDRVLASTLFGSDILEEGVLRMNGSPCSTAFRLSGPFPWWRGPIRASTAGLLSPRPNTDNGGSTEISPSPASCLPRLDLVEPCCSTEGSRFTVGRHAKSGSCLHNSKHSARLEGLQAHKVGLDTALHHAAALAQASKQPEPPASLAVSHLRRRTSASMQRQNKL